MDSEVKDFLSDGRRLSLAWDIHEAFHAMSNHVYQTFWGNVKNSLENCLMGKSDLDRWSIVFDENDCASMFIQPAGLVKGSCAFKFGAESLKGADGACYFGIHRGKTVKKEGWVESDVELSQRMVADGFKSSLTWPGWMYIRNIGLPNMERKVKDELLELNDDNGKGNHPRAECAASAIIELFDKYRQHVEDLNKLYPY